MEYNKAMKGVENLKIAIVNKSDSTGGAAVVSFRLMEALRRAGADARMVVAEKLTDSPFVSVAAPEWQIKIPFFSERLKIFIENRFNRSTLFKIDTASDGLDLMKNTVVPPTNSGSTRPDPPTPGQVWRSWRRCPKGSPQWLCSPSA